MGNKRISKYKIENFKGKTIFKNGWKIISVSHDNYWNVVCGCGKKGIVRACLLLGNCKRKSERCHTCSKNKYPIDKYIGKTINDWKVLSFSHRDKQKQHYWDVQCKCGAIKKVRTSHIVRGRSKQCVDCGRQSASEKKWMGGKFISASMYLRYKHSSENRNIPFKISIKDMEKQWNKQNGICPYTKEQLTFPKRNKDSNFTASLDRINSNKGYTKSNIEWVHKKINVMKMSLSKKEFIDVCKKVSKSFS